MLVAGVDCSTQATKVVIIDAADGRIVARAKVPHRVSGANGRRESNPEEWWTAMGVALRETGRVGDVAAIAVAAQQHALVVLDADGVPLRPAPLWNDTTSAADADRLIAELGGPAVWSAQLGSVPTTAFTVAKWASLRRSAPTMLDQVKAVRLPHDFLTERLGGRAVSDRGDASGTGWWSPADEGYVPEVLALESVGLDAELLPEVLSGAEPVATAGDGAGAKALGLPSGTVVAAGTGDNMAAAVGLGLAPGTPGLSLGTSGTVFALADRPADDPTGTIAGFADAGQGFMPLACTLNATLAVDRVAAWLRLEREDVEPAGEVTVLPYLDGERTPNYPRAASTITGLRHDTTSKQILQAAYDGVVEGLLAALDKLDEVSRCVDSGAPLVLAGGGSMGDAWRATVSRLSGRSVRVSMEPELVAVGAAALAAVSLSGGAAATIAREWASRKPSLTIEPVERDEARRAHLRAVRELLEPLNEVE